ncbi:MAG: DMT family transporter [Thermoguttaceae bacterium]
MAGRLYVLAAALLWSLCGLFARAPVFDDWSVAQRGLLFAFWRAAFVAMVLLPTIRRPRFRSLLVPLTISFALMNATYLSAISLTTPANAIWLQSAAPWWVFIISVFVFREPVSRQDLVPLAFGMAGVGTILVFEIVAHPGQNLVGIACGIISGVAYGGVVFFMGKLNGENAPWLVALNHAVAAAVMFPLVVWFGLWPSPVELLVLAAFGVFQMAIPYVLLIHGLRSIRAQEAVSIGLIEPVLMPLWTWWIWGVSAAWWTILGGALILIGLLCRYVFFSDSTVSLDR